MSFKTINKDFRQMKEIITSKIEVYHISFLITPRLENIKHSGKIKGSVNSSLSTMTRILEKILNLNKYIYLFT